MRLSRLAIWIGLIALAFPRAQARIQVDIDANQDRNDTQTRHWDEWTAAAGTSVAHRVEGLTITFAQVDPTAALLADDWWKGGLATGGTMVTDGLTARGGRIVMTIEGLTPGPHTVVTYHNEFSDEPIGPFDVFVGDNKVAEDVRPTQRAPGNEDATSVFVEVEARAGEPVMILFRPTGGNGRWIVNGFEIDAVDPARKALKPSPAHDDEHADGDAGYVTLGWTPAASAVSHDVYLGGDAATVAGAGRADAAFKGNRTDAAFRAEGLNAFDDYSWRVDEVDAAGNIARGDVWRFRVRRLAFPTAEGYGRFARGGRGGRVIEVTNLNDSGPGSLRAALQAEGPRTVVFNVGGVIQLERPLGIRNPYITVAGQTAPGNGICVSGASFGVGYSRDVILRFVRTRVGDASGRTQDGMGLAGCDHSIVDHCSISWSIDEGFSSRGARNITLQRSIIGEALNMSIHDHYEGSGKGHGFAASIGGDVGSFHHNLLVHCAGRNWSLAGGIDQANRHHGRLDIRNNVVYNWVHRTTDGGAQYVNFVNNYYKPGPATAEFEALNPQFENPAFGPQMYYVEGNVMEGRHGPEGPEGPFRGVDPDPDTPFAEFTVTTPFFEPHVETQTAEEAFTSVLADVGCNRPVLDDLDARLIRETREGTTTYGGFFTGMPGIIDTVADTPGLPDYPEVARPADHDTDHDGMPNAWESARGLDPDGPADGNADRDGDGYTNLEDYLNWLAGDLETS
jgi:hypothetical protein